MAETGERGAGAASGERDATRGVESTEEEDELRAEEESAKAMEAEVPQPPGYPDPGQKQPS